MLIKMQLETSDQIAMKTDLHLKILVYVFSVMINLISIKSYNKKSKFGWGL